MDGLEVIKQREIRFRRGIDGNMLADAAALLGGADGVLAATPRTDSLTVELRYDLRRIGLELIEDALAELGYPLDASLGARMHRALVYYTEETQRANLGIDYDLPHATQEAFVEQWRQRPHGCRDHRPAHWRRYW